MKIKLISLALAIGLSGCNALGGPTGKNIKQSIINRTPEVALKKIKYEDYGDTDAVLYFLEKGSLHKYAGQHSHAHQSFEAAKDKMEEMYTASVTKNVGAILVNDNVNNYDGEFYENIMAHIYQAQLYLENGNTENAAVIARQLDTKLTLLENKKADEELNEVYKCDPYAHYLSGLIYESREEWDSARITYEKAVNCYDNSIYNLTAPEQLKKSLVSVAYRAGDNSRYRRYKNEFGIDKDQLNGKTELVFVLDEGFVVAKRERSASVTATTPNGIRQVKIAMPEMPEVNAHLLNEVRVMISEVRDKTRDQVVMAEKVHDLDSAAKVALDERLPAIRLRAIARAVKNQGVQNEAENKGGFFAKLGAMVLTNVIEKADLRGWKSLPHTIWMSRATLEPGTYNVNVELVGHTGKVMNIKQYKNIVIEEGKKKHLYLRWGATPHKNKNKNANMNLFLL